MIDVDPRKGSAELCPLLNVYGSRKGVTAKAGAEMPAGDFAFDGHGPHGKVRVGVERKRVKDLINSMRTGRLGGHQIPEMLKLYDYGWVLVEGIWRGNPENGILEEAVYRGWREVRLGSAGFSFAEINNFLLSISIQSPLKISRTDTIHDTALFIVELYKWFQKPWSAHRSVNKVFYHPLPNRALLTKPSLTRRMANEVRGLGWEKTAAVDTYFKSPVEMICATEAEWRRMPGIDKVLSKRIVRAMNTGKEEEE